jgi:hypothetical protein
MKAKSTLKRLLGYATAGLALLAIFGSCGKKQVDWTEFGEATIGENLASIEAATEAYNTALATGGIDAACAAARDFLANRPGVARVTITPDSLTWATFANALVAGVGVPRRPVDSKATAPAEHPVRGQSGGEAGDLLQEYVTPFPLELPGTALAASRIRATFEDKLDWENPEYEFGTAVDLEAAIRVLGSAPGVLLWGGHGVEVPGDTEVTIVPALVLGIQYSSPEAAVRAITEHGVLFDLPPGSAPLVCVLSNAETGKYELAITPAFVRRYGSFQQPPQWPYFNHSRTFVHLSCCYSIDGGALSNAFLEAGAALVCGYTWEVGDAWSASKDTAFYAALADTCLPNEALASLGDIEDPVPGRNGWRARFAMHGDTLAMLQPVFQAEIDGALYRPMPSAVVVTAGEPMTATTALQMGINPGRTGTIYLAFPGAPGSYNVPATENASVAWIDNQSQLTYVSGTNMVGVDFTITVNRVQNDILVCHFSGRLGRWTSGSPYETPPNEVVTFTEGIIKYTGRMVGSQAAYPERGGFVGWAAARR